MRGGATCLTFSVLQWIVSCLAHKVSRCIRVRTSGISARRTCTLIEKAQASPVPVQVTLVPDDPSQLTSNHGWDTRRNLDFLKGVVNELHAHRIRVSIFVDPDPVMVEYALRTGADRVELYTGPYAEMYNEDPKKAIEKYRPAAEKAHELGLGLNAGHDLNPKNLKPRYEQQG